MSNEGRSRHRQGTVRMVRGVPYSNRATTLSLLPGAAVGRWLARRTDDLGGVLLDLGAGNQPFRPWYGERVQRVVAIDAAPAPGIDALSFAAPLPFQDKAFDVVLCTSVLEHVDDAEAAVSEIARVLKPGGRLLITVPFLYPTHEAPYDYWRTTHYGLRSVLQRHGLQVDEIAAQGGPVLLAVHFAVLAVVAAIRALAGALGRFRWLVDNKAVSALIAAPQEMCRNLVSTDLGPLSRAVSLGYMACATKQA